MNPNKTHLVVILIPFDSQRRILLQQRTDDAPYMPGMWGFFGGGIEKGETPEEAVKREALEELNFSMANPIPLLSQSFEINGEPAFMYVFINEFLGEKTGLELHEGKDWGWFVPSDIPNLGMTSRDIFIAKTAFEAITKDSGTIINDNNDR